MAEREVVVPTLCSQKKRSQEDGAPGDFKQSPEGIFASNFKFVVAKEWRSEKQ